MNHSERILFGDDEHRVTDVPRWSLNSMLPRAYLTSLEMLRSHGPFAEFSDLKVPAMDGVEFQLGRMGGKGSETVILCSSSEVVQSEMSRIRESRRAKARAAIELIGTLRHADDSRRSATNQTGLSRDL